VDEAEFLRDTRAGYDAVAADYAERFREELDDRALDRAVLGAFAELVRGTGAPVADVGCGTGRVSALLSGFGVEVSGIDLSPQMIEQARLGYPGLRFEVGSMLALDLPDASRGGVLAWYSTIHVPDERLGDAFAEFRRVLVPGGYVLLGFQVGEEPVHLTQALGHQVSMTFRRRQPGWVAGRLAEAGLDLHAQVIREPDTDGRFREPTPQAFLLARKQ
jgi:ubiquinone/menaquinone biosynthesis C-methylase UbiE